MNEPSLPGDVATAVARALAEDIGAGDLTSALVAPDAVLHAEITAREEATLCGAAWVDAAFHQLDTGIAIDWRTRDGARCEPGTVVCTLAGNARALLTAERTALNWLQTLSATATATARFCAAVEGTGARILDTRKTLPGLRLAQKYAVRCGGGTNHRIGLFDAILIKENHIAALGSIRNAVARAKTRAPHVMIEVEVEDMAQLEEALETPADRLLLDEFSLAELREARRLRDAHPGDRKELEASGSVDLDSVRGIAETGVDFISVGSLTKHVQAIDFSLRFV
jgi:nicotinate-nucleotide pyrophosphorylase (carboxylating)